MFVIVLFSLIAVASAGVIQHGEHGVSHGQATSYQHVKIENYHPVPVYLKKEYNKFAEHPVSKGHTATNVQVHHGHQDHGHGHHDHGYAITSGTHEHGLAAGQAHLPEVNEHEEQGLGAYQTAGHIAQSYGGQAEADYGHEGGYEQGESAGYGQEDAGGYGQEGVKYTHADNGYDHEAYAQAAAAAAAGGGEEHGHAGHHYQHQ